MSIFYHLSWCWLWLLSFAFGISEASATVIGAGATLPHRLYEEAAFAYRLETEELVVVEYTAMSSARGKCRLMSHSAECDPSDASEPISVDFAASDSVLRDADYQKYSDLQMFPTAGVAAVPIYNLGMATQLVLTPAAVAGIFSGHIRTWDDPNITATNPHFSEWGIPAGQPIEVVVFSADSGLSEIFTKSLSSYDAGFRQQIGPTSKPEWAGVPVTTKATAEEALLHVAVNDYTIGYASLGDAQAFNMPTVKIQRGDSIVEATVRSIEFAVLELGLEFGNNGEPSERLTADLHGAHSPRAWPFCGYTYLVVRKETLRAGSSCEDVKEMVDFWHWFWRTGAVTEMAVSHGFSALPDVVRDVVLGQFLTDMKCNGHPAWDGGDGLIPITVVGPNHTEDLFAQLKQLYSLLDSQVSIRFILAEVEGQAAIEERLKSAMIVVSVKRPEKPISNGATVALAAAGIAVISSLDVILDLKTLAMILDGRITTWLHPAVRALNPDGVPDEEEGLLRNESQPIVLVQGPFGSSISVRHIMQMILPGYTGAALRQARRFPTEADLRGGVLHTKYSLSITPLNNKVVPPLKLLRLKRDDGHLVSPTWQAVQTCAGHDDFDSDKFLHSKALGCYPLAEAMYLNVKRSRCNLSSDAARTSAIAFVEWLLSGRLVDMALQQDAVAPLHSYSSKVQAENEEALNIVSCTRQFTTSLAIILGAIIGVVVPVFIAAGFCWWRSSRKMRAMREKFSNDNVAQECAAAIAHFDLDSVAWLNDVQKPNKIQRSFLQIVHLLKEVKPYIPDQLLTTLMHGDEHPSDDHSVSLSKEKRQGTGVSSHNKYSVDTSTVTSKHSNISRLESVGSLSHSEGSGKMRRPRSASGPSTSAGSSDACNTTMTVTFPMKPKGERRIAGTEWVFKRCTYMQVRFGCPGERDPRALLEPMSQVAAQLVTIGKSHGATIDKVSFDGLTLHWGLVGNRSASAQQAAVAAMEMEDVRELLSQDLQPQFRIQIGVGTGMCAAATLSAVGHRFFIIAGREVTIANDISIAPAVAAVKCNVLISQEMYREVRYSVNCTPRLWLGTELLWEPVQLREQVGSPDEWMYELKDMEDQECQFTGHQLLPVFEMVHKGASSTEVQSVVQRLKTMHCDAMSEQDIACLDHLLATVK